MSLKEIILQKDLYEFTSENCDQRMVFILFHPSEEECNQNVLTKLYELSEKDLYEDIAFAQVDLSLDWAEEYLFEFEPENFYVHIYQGKCLKV